VNEECIELPATMKEGFHVSFIFHEHVLSEGSVSGKLVRYGSSKHGMKRYGFFSRLCVEKSCTRISFIYDFVHVYREWIFEVW